MLRRNNTNLAVQQGGSSGREDRRDAIMERGGWRSDIIYPTYLVRDTRGDHNVGRTLAAYGYIRILERCNIMEAGDDGTFLLFLHLIHHILLLVFHELWLMHICLNLFSIF